MGELIDILKTINVKNYREFYHDSIEHREEMASSFNLGLLSLQERAKGEAAFWKIAAKAVRYSKAHKFISDEFVELEKQLVDKLVCNFSVFQSIPDQWALDQLYPVVPIQRLRERPEKRVTLVDITCDSEVCRPERHQGSPGSSPYRGRHSLLSGDSPAGRVSGHHG